MPPASPQTAVDGLLAAFATGGEMGARMAATDWAATPLGPIDSWPQSLVSSVSILLNSRAQIVLFWGPEYVALYNDAYAPTIGDKHPHALGRPAREYWTELWEMLEPMLAGVRRSGVAFSAADHPFFIDRRGFLEDVYFDISYDPVRVEDGSVDGVFCIVSETTGRVLTKRRLQTLTSIDAALATATTSDSALRQFLATVEGSPDLPFVRVLPSPGATSDRAFFAGDTSLVPDVPTVGATGDIKVDGATVALVLPLRAAAVDLGSIVLGVNPRYDLDEDYRGFLRFVAERLATALLNVQVYEYEHRLAATLQRAILPGRLADVAGLHLAGEYLPATAGLDVGGDWYDAVPLAGGRVGLVIGDVAGKGVNAAAVMGQMRNALRAYLVDTPDPADALTRTNRLFGYVDGAPFVTVLCLVLDPTSGEVRWSSAGHLPALLAEPGGPTRYLSGALGPPIGVDPGHAYVDGATHVAPGSLLALFTDGLVEERSETLDTGLLRASAALDASRSGAGRVVDAAITGLGALRPEDRRADDVAIVVAQLTGP